jgi:hypothetical protein
MIFSDQNHVTLETNNNAVPCLPTLFFSIDRRLLMGDTHFYKNGGEKQTGHINRIKKSS